MCLQCCHLTRLFFNKTPPCHTYGKRHLRTDSQSYKLFLCITKPKSFHCMHSKTLVTLGKLAISNEELHNTTELCEENISPMSESCHIHVRVKSVCNKRVRNCMMLVCEMTYGKQSVSVCAKMKLLVIEQHRD